MAISLCGLAGNNTAFTECDPNWVNPVQEVKLPLPKLTPEERSKMFPPYFRSEQHRLMCLELIGSTPLERFGK